MSDDSSTGPVNVGILTIGNEVLNGLVLDTNANWLDAHIASLGLQVIRHATVRDILEEIGKGIDFLSETCQVIITSGGLGPTFDDMTLEAVAKHLGLELKENREAMQIIERQYRLLYELGIVDSPVMNEPRRKMGIIPEESIPLNNEVGGAPGVMLTVDQFTLICLPGVPKELKFIFQNSVLPWLIQQTDLKYKEEIVDFPLRDETVMAPHISKVMNMNNGVYIKSMPKSYGSSPVLRVWISTRGKDEDELLSTIHKTIKDLESESGLKSKPPTSEK